MAIVASTAERISVRSELDVRVYRSGNDTKWYWQMINKGNRENEGASGQGFVEKRSCLENLYRVTGFQPDVIVDEVGDDQGS